MQPVFIRKKRSGFRMSAYIYGYAVPVECNYLGGRKLVLNIEIEHDIKKNYLVIKGEEEPTYMLKMLEGNSIKGFLDLEVRVLDNQNQYYYDITGKESLVAKSDREKWDCNQLIELFSQVLHVIGKSKEYLLSPNHFLLQPEYMYQDLGTAKVAVCYAWEFEKDINEQLVEFFSYFMNVLKYDDKNAVELVYRLYEYSREEHCTLQRLWSGLAETKIEREEQNHESILHQQSATSFPTSVGEKMKGIKKLEHIAKGEKREKPEFLTRKKASNQEETEQTSFIKGLGQNNRIKKKGEDVYAEKEKIRENTGMKKKIVLTIALQLFLLSGVFWGAKCGFFIEEEGLSYEKAGGAVILLGIIDMYALSVIFRENEQEEREIRKIFSEPSKGEGTHGEIVVTNIDGTAILATKEKETKKDDFCDTEEMKKEVTGCYFVPNAKDGQVIQMFQFPFFVGRFQKDTNEFYESKNISRMHCKVECIGGEYYIVDLNSTNGTYVNQQKLQENVKKRLHEGDQVSFADVCFRFTKNFAFPS